MKPAPHDATDSPDVTANLAGIAASPGPFSPDPFSGTGPGR